MSKLTIMVEGGGEKADIMRLVAAALPDDDTMQVTCEDFSAEGIVHRFTRRGADEPECYEWESACGEYTNPLFSQRDGATCQKCLAAMNRAAGAESEDTNG